MADTYFATFCLGRPGRSPSMEKVIAEVRGWLLGPRPGVDVVRLQALDLSVSGDHPLGEASLLVRHAHDAELTLAGFRLKHPDSDEPDREWLSEVILARREEGDFRVAIRTNVRRTGSVVRPLQIPASRPTLTGRLISTFDAWEGALGLVDHAIAVGLEEFDQYFLTALESPHRTVPLVVVSAGNDDRHLVDAELVADRLAGVALVCAFTSRQVSWRLSALLTRDWSVWDGGVRVYWPAPNLSEPPRDVVFSRSRMGVLGDSARVADELLGIVSRASTSRSAVGLARWSELERRINEARIEDARRRGDNAELARLLYEEKDDLSAAKTELEEQVRELTSDLERARQDASYWRQLYQDSQKSSPTPADDGASEAPPATTVEEALQQAAQLYPDRLALQLNSASDAATPFEDVDAISRALGWVATQYVDAKTGHKPCADLDSALKAQAGFFYKPNQAATTVGQYRSEYETQWRGRKVPLTAHIGKGTGRDPRHAIRIAFHFDEETRKVVVGYVGQHQTTGDS